MHYTGYSTIMDALAQGLSSLVKTKAKIMPVEKEKDAVELQQVPAADPSAEVLPAVVSANGEVEEEAEQHVASVVIHNCVGSLIIWQDAPKVSSQ